MASFFLISWTCLSKYSLLPASRLHCSWCPWLSDTFFHGQVVLLLHDQSFTSSPLVCHSLLLNYPVINRTIEGFGGKRALNILRKIELYQKRFKFRMQFCLGVLNNVLHVFSRKLTFFFRYYVCEKTH